MTSLFVPPKFESGLAGAKLTFSITGTSTPQNTYTDEALLVASSNPVVADANGVFAPIYFDGKLDSYRVKYETAAGVLIYQLDGVPSSPGNQSTSLVVSEKNNPKIRLTQTQASSGKKNWMLQVKNDQLLISLMNDALSTEAACLAISRSGNNASVIGWTTASHTINGDESHRGNSFAKTGISSKNTTTTLAADPELVIALQAGHYYVIESELYFYATTTAAMGFKFDVSYSGTSSTTRQGIMQSFVNSAGSVATMPSFPATPISFATISTNAAAPDCCRFSYNIQPATAGNLSLRWAQVSSSANNLNLMSHSWIRASGLL